MSIFCVVEDERRFFYRKLSQSSQSTILINSPSGDFLISIKADSVKSFEDVSLFERNESPWESTSSFW